MTDPTRSARSRRGGRRPGWLLLTVLLVLAIGASSALVFTNQVQLLKLAVILALWAAVVAAFVSVIYRRQSDMDQAKVRDLKLVYDLQLDREISARREYELSVETQLRRELVSELRAQAADEVAGLRAELAALRANLEILFDADLSDRPAIETDRSRFRGYSDNEWQQRTPETAGRVTSSRIDTEDRDDGDFRTDESPIIDVPEEPHPPQPEPTPPVGPGGVHRLPSDHEPEGRRQTTEEPPAWTPPPAPPPIPTPPPQPPPAPEPVTRETQFPWLPSQEPPQPPEPPAPQPEPERVSTQTTSPDWQPAPAEGQWIPAGAPGSNWVSPEEAASRAQQAEADSSAQQAEANSPAQPEAENGSSVEYVGRRRAPDLANSTAPSADIPTPQTTDAHSQPAMSSPPPEPPPKGRHSAPPDAVDPGRPPAAPTLAAEPAQPPPHSEPAPHSEPQPAEPPAPPRHRSADDDPETGGQSVADLLARLQAAPSGGGGRRRREE